ncbi:GNAT family N-acetyltransferase [Brucella rhizosphaerae]|uniref:Acetyltransferase domain protein n=1 Tax=Brucella rhizosphaerae TaxID=571254 RepID=A0A256FXM8_9HYPH|nr:GNAT family N-acetyltransferase [Brucella rhizosphaerae]OYR19595.1 acetyltransferase domain protein [Brucella rhizosphaerae]
MFETPRLILQASYRAHAAALFEEYTGREDAARYLQRRAHTSQFQTETFIDAWGEINWLNSSRFVWTILHRADKKPIGMFLMFIEGSSAEIHYGLGPSYWGQGLATETGIAVMDWVTDQSGLALISTSCATAHVTSLRVLEKIGLHRTQLLSSQLPLASTGTKVDAWLYSWKRS